MPLSTLKKLLPVVWIKWGCSLPVVLIYQEQQAFLTWYKPASFTSRTIVVQSFSSPPQDVAQISSVNNLTFQI